MPEQAFWLMLSRSMHIQMARRTAGSSRCFSLRAQLKMIRTGEGYSLVTMFSDGSARSWSTNSVGTVSKTSISAFWTAWTAVVSSEMME